jgi:hypothetical protein
MRGLLGLLVLVGAAAHAQAPSLTALVPLFAGQSGAEVNQDAAARLNQEYLVPAPGRVTLVVESAGAPQTVGIWLNTRTQMSLVQGGIPVPTFTDNYKRLCTTPCTLYVEPGMVPLFTGGEPIEKDTTELQVPEGGLRVVMKAPYRLIRVGGTALIVIGAAAVVLGLLAIVGSAASGAPPEAPSVILSGVGLGVLAGGIAIRVGYTTGLQKAVPLGEPPFVAPTVQLPRAGQVMASVSF